MFGALSSAHQILVLLSLKGGPEYDAQMQAASAETNAFGRSLLKTSAAMRVATQRTWLHNQALFTARRYAFYATLAVTALAFEVAKLGFQYQSTIQTTRVALSTILKPHEMDAVINRLYRISTLSPFLFQDTVQAFRQLYPAFHAAGLSSKLALDSIQGSANALAVQGKLTTGQLTRVSVQLQHMANIGRPTGQVLTALARDGLPVYPALRKELHLTGLSLTDLASSGITAKQTIAALNKYMMTQAPYAGAAERISMKTLQGNWQMFKDILAQASGRATGGLFSGLTQRLADVNKALIGPFSKNQPITMTMIAEAIDKSLTPRTHAIINLFLIFTTTVKTLVTELFLLLGIIQLILFPLDYFASLMGQNWAWSKLFGIVLGTLITLWTLAWVRITLLNLVEESQIILVRTLRMLYLLWAFAVRVWNAATELAILINIWWNREVETTRLLLIGAAIATAAWTAMTNLWTDSTIAATAAQWALNIAMYANPIGLIILGVLLLTAGLIVLYIKWKRFHDAVNATFKFLWSHPWAAALIPVVGQLIIMAKVLLAIYNNAARIADLARHPLRHLEHATGGGWLGTATSVAGWITNPIGSFAGLAGMQHGGFVGSGGMAIVGERGPELLHLPTASVVQPFASNMVNGGLAIHIYPQDIYFDSKKIGSVLATAITDKEARR